MDLLMNSMALFWAMAEIWILLFLIRGIATACGKPVRIRRHRLLCCLSGVLLSILAFGGTRIARQLTLFQTPLALHVYRCAQWHFFCTFWVIFEGLIMIYVFRIYVMLKRSGPNGETNAFNSDPLTTYFRMAAVALISLFAGFYGLYEYHTWILMRTSALTYIHVNRISTFFINVCGVFWVLFDGGVAILGYHTFKLLHRHRHRSDGINHANTAPVG